MNRRKLVALVTSGATHRVIAKSFACSQANVQHWLRKYGLKTVKASIPRVPKGSMTQCVLCERKYAYERHRGHRPTVCNSCNANRKRRSVKLKAIAYKGGKCEVCGYDKCPGALQFHHRDPKKKDFIIGVAQSRAWSVLRKELNKCALLCANCHAELRYVGASATNPPKPGFTEMFRALAGRPGDSK